MMKSGAGRPMLAWTIEAAVTTQGQKQNRKESSYEIPKFQASSATSDHNLQNSGNLAPGRETGDAEHAQSLGTPRSGSEA